MRIRVPLLVGAIFLAGASGAFAAAVYQRVTVGANADAVWQRIGPFCAIKDWHPAIGQCTQEAKTRTLTTKDGGTFVETETARTPLSYSYKIDKSPLPITGYRSTVKVSPRNDGRTTIEWSGTYTPSPGKEQAADDALMGIYKAGLDNLPKLLGK